jgi:large subunit ribosomal protein L28
MARACALCGKTALPGFNQQSSGNNRVRTHRRLQPNLQPTVVTVDGGRRRALVCTRCRRTLTKEARLAERA